MYKSCLLLHSGQVLKDKVNTNFCTDSKLVATSDNLDKALFIHEFLTLQGYKLPTVMFLEDVMSTIALIFFN